MKQDRPKVRLVPAAAPLPRPRQAPESPQTVIQRTDAGAPIGLCTIDTELRYRLINDWMAELNGLPAAEHIGKRVSEVIPDGVGAEIEEQLRQALRTGEPLLRGTSFMETAAHPGEKRHYEHSYYPETSEHGDVVGLRCLLLDVTHRKRAEEELRRAHGALQSEVEQRTQQLAIANARLEEGLSELERLYESAPVGLCLLDTDLRFVRINEGLAKINDLRVDDYIGRTLREVVPHVADQVEDLFLQVLKSGEPIVDTDFGGLLPEAGLHRVWRTSTYCLTDSQDHVTGLSVVVQEITDLRNAQRALEERLRFETLTADLAVRFPRLAPEEIRLSKLRVDISVVTERLENSIKMTGDSYFSKMYTMLEEKLLLKEWRESIHKKLNIIQDLYQVHQDRLDTLHGELLEVIIIILIMLEIGLALWGH